VWQSQGPAARRSRWRFFGRPIVSRIDPGRRLGIRVFGAGFQPCADVSDAGA
jgi:hypothetical protein